MNFKLNTKNYFMKAIILLFLITSCSFINTYSQTAKSALKTKHKSSNGYSTSFTPVKINGQNGMKAAQAKNSSGPYRNLGSKALDSIPSEPSSKKIIYGADSIIPIYYEHINTSNLKASKIQTAEQHCFSFLESIKQDLKIDKSSQCFIITSTISDSLGQQHIRLSQKFKGVKVYNADFYVHFSGDKEILNGKYSVIESSLNVIPKVTKDQALQIAINDLKNTTEIADLSNAQKELLNYYGPQIDTVVLDNKKSFIKFSLAYHIVIRPNFIDEWYYFISAENGEIIKKYNNTKYDGPATATANDLNGVSRTIDTDQQNGHFTMLDVAEPMFNSSNRNGSILTVDAQNSTGDKYFDINSSNNNWDNNPNAVSAQFNAKQSYLYYKNTFKRNSINGSGGSIISFINIANEDGSGLDNAFWNGKWMSYGNGDFAFTPLAGGLDVAGHEMTHGVTQYTAALEYKGESGAINESISDIFGAMVDRSNWFIGESVTKTSFITSGHLRDMSNPHNFSNPGDPGWQPMNTNEMYFGDNEGTVVHTNSGIPNYAYYLISTAITKEKAEQIYYRALTTYLTKSSQFIDLRIAIEQSAKDLYGDNSNELSQAKKAFDTVGIYEQTPTTNSDTYPSNPGQDYLLVTNTDPADVNTLYRSSTDAITFSPLTTTKMISRPTVIDNGSIAGFVAADHTIHSISLNPSNPNESIFSSEKIWENVAVSKDGSHIAAITTAIDTAIFVYDINSKKWAKFHLYNPTTEGVTQKGGVLYADALEFDKSGENLIYDSYNLIRSTKTDSISYWDIGVINIWDNENKKFGTGSISKLFSNLPDSVSIGNPTFANNSSNVIAFDIVKGDNIFGIFGLNTETLDLGIIASNNTVGYPSYSKLDNKVVFNSLDNSNGLIISQLPLNANKISTPSVDATTIITGAKWPVFYATGTRVLGFAPKADFTSSFISGKVPLNTVFLDQSKNNPTSWEWTFESGNPSTSTSQNPKVSYTSTGTYAVTLKASNSYGSNSVTKTGYIVVSAGTDIKEEGLKQTLRIFPNPTISFVEIEFNNPFQNDYKIEILNTLGSILNTISKQKNDLNAHLDLTAYPRGFYVIKISSANKIYQSKIIKK